MYKVGVVGDTGITGNRLVDLLNQHPFVSVGYKKSSKTETGKLEDVGLVFLATKEGVSMDVAPELIGLDKRVIDLSGAYRIPLVKFEKWYGVQHSSPELISRAVYGMPALNAEGIGGAELVANPGCYATGMILALHHLVKHGLVDNECTVTATSGISGAGKMPEEPSNEVAYSYGKKHKHVPEVEEYVSLKGGFKLENFTPIVLKSVYSGINANIVIGISDELMGINPDAAANILKECLMDSYLPEDMIEAFTFNENPSAGTLDVNGSNNLIIKIGVDGRYANVISLLDNLGKGSATQAIENMNLMLGVPRLAGIAHSL
ncbi:MAG: hypothetical protein Q8R04_00435 [Nanoarchaeota archaeon]|nr:hypothetical protein [Nanoarchaeota archaeon]